MIDPLLTSPLGDLFLVYVQSRVEHLQLSKKDLTTTTLSRSLDEDEEVFTESTSNVLELGSRLFEFFANILGLFKDGRNRHAVVASGIVMIAQYDVTHSAHWLLR